MSEAGSEASSYVSTHRDAAAALGARLADVIDEPELFVTALREGLATLSDAAYVLTVQRVSPGTGGELSVRGPLVRAIQRPLRRALKEGSGASALWLGQRLAQCDERELRLFTLPCLERSMRDDPERTWQLMRRLGSRAGDWIEVDSLAEIWARGVFQEPFRWAELEQLIYSDRHVERRLVGATLANIPHLLARSERHSLRDSDWDHAFALLRQLIGDAEPLVQKSLSWAIREWADVDSAGVGTFLREESALAVKAKDGNRAWVIRDALSSQPTEVASELKQQLRGMRRIHHATSTSIAASQAAAFASAVRAQGAASQQGDRYTRSRP